MDTKTIVRTAWNEALVNKDASAVDRYWGDLYVQHNPLAPDGKEAVKGLISMLSANPAFSYELVRAVADGDMVALHGRYTGWMDEPVIVFDLVRLEDGMMVEHWDGVQIEAPANPSGRTMLDGPSEIRDLDRTDSNKAVVSSFLDTILIQGRFETIGRFFEGDAYLQHNPQIPDGVTGLGEAIAAMADRGMTMEYAKVHRVIGEGDFVLAQSEGTFAGAPHAFYDLFRLEGGVIAEHWDVMQEVPASSANDNGMF